MSDQSARSTIGEIETPRTDSHLAHLNLPDGRKVGIPNETVALLRQLERESEYRWQELRRRERTLESVLSQSERIYTKADMEAACKIAVAAHKNYGKSAADFAETQLKRACHLLREANPERRAWAEDRDQFLEIVGEFKEPKE